MTEINDKISLRRFLARIFISDSQVSSRRVGGFLSLVALLFLVFFKYPMSYVDTMAMLVFGFFALTTTTSLFQKKVDDNNKG